MSDLAKPEEALQVELVAHDQDGTEIVQPVPPGTDVTEVEQKLRAVGGRLSFIRFRPPRRARPAGVSSEDFARFNELLASAVRRGVPMPDGIRSLASEFRGGRFETALDHVEENLRRGASLKDAFAPESSGFPALYSRMMEAGAASGNLSSILLSLSRNIRTDVVFRRGVVEACVYPFVLLVASCALLAGFAAGLLPTYEAIAPALSVSIPRLTRLVATSNVPLQAVAIAVVLLAGVAAFFILRTEPMMRRLPFFGSLYEAAMWSSAADTLALLIRVDVPAPAALRLVGPASGSRWLNRTFGRLAAAAETGRALSVASREDQDVPSRFNHALDIGERRGDLASAMSELAERYRYESRRRSQLLVRYLPPAFALLFGVIVLLVAMSVLGPYFRFWGGEW